MAETVGEVGTSDELAPEEDVIVLNIEIIESKKKMDRYGVSMTMSEGTPTQMEIGVGTLYILRELTDHHKVCIELGKNVETAEE